VGLITIGGKPERYIGLHDAYDFDECHRPGRCRLRRKDEGHPGLTVHPQESDNGCVERQRERQAREILHPSSEVNRPHYVLAEVNIEIVGSWGDGRRALFGDSKPHSQSFRVL
jgi:hypothetical protein